MVTDQNNKNLNLNLTACMYLALFFCLRVFVCALSQFIFGLAGGCVAIYLTGQVVNSTEGLIFTG
jgi:hypothetical protein